MRTGVPWLLVGVLLGLLVSTGAQSPTPDPQPDQYTRTQWTDHYSPKCPAGTSPVLWGIATTDSMSQYAIYQCVGV